MSRCLPGVFVLLTFLGLLTTTLPPGTLRPDRLSGRALPVCRSCALPAQAPAPSALPDLPLAA